MAFVGLSLIVLSSLDFLRILRQDEEFVGAPNRRTRFDKGDMLTVYGKEGTASPQLTPGPTLAAEIGQDGRESQ